MGDVFKALADESRRALLDALKEEDGQPLGRLCQRLPRMTRFGVSAHLKVLQDAGLVTTVKAGRTKLHYLNAVPLVELQQRWLSDYTRDAALSLLALRRSLEEPMTADPTAPRPDVVFSIYIRASLEHVWEALTETSRPRPWLYGTVAESTWLPGTPYTLSAEGFPIIAGEVLEADPPRHLRLTFDARWDETVSAEPAGVLDYLLEPADESATVTRLVVTLSGLVGDTAQSAEADTPQIYSSLKSLLETGEAL